MTDILPTDPCVKCATDSEDCNHHSCILFLEYGRALETTREKIELAISMLEAK